MESGNSRKYRTKNPLVKRALGHFLTEVEQLVDMTGAEHILDAGCGEGFVLTGLGLRYVNGLDISGEAILEARVRNQDAALLVGTIASLPYKEGSFDLVLSIETLEHLDTPEDALAELQRVTRQYCIVSVPHEPFFSAMNLCRGKNLARLGSDVDHRQKWGRREFERLVGRYFEIVDVKTPFPWILILGRKKRQRNRPG